MASFHVGVNAAKGIFFRIMSEESLPDGSKIPSLRCEHVFTVAAAKSLKARLNNAIEALEDEAEETEVEKMVDADLDDADADTGENA